MNSLTWINRLVCFVQWGWCSRADWCACIASPGEGREGGRGGTHTHTHTHTLTHSHTLTHNEVTRMQYTRFSPQYYIINVDINFSAWLGTNTATNSVPLICYMAPVGGHVYGQQLTQSLTHII